MMEDDIELTGVARSAHGGVKTKTFDTEQAESSGKDHGYYYRKPRLEVRTAKNPSCSFYGSI